MYSTHEEDTEEKPMLAESKSKMFHALSLFRKKTVMQLIMLMIIVFMQLQVEASNDLKDTKKKNLYDKSKTYLFFDEYDKFIEDNYKEVLKDAVADITDFDSLFSVSKKMISKIESNEQIDNLDLLRKRLVYYMDTVWQKMIYLIPKEYESKKRNMSVKEFQEWQIDIIDDISRLEADYKKNCPGTFLSSRSLRMKDDIRKMKENLPKEDVWDSSKEFFLRGVITKYAKRPPMITRSELTKFTSACSPSMNIIEIKEITDYLWEKFSSQNNRPSIENIISLFKEAWEDDSEAAMKELRNLGFQMNDDIRKMEDYDIRKMNEYVPKMNDDIRKMEDYLAKMDVYVPKEISTEEDHNWANCRVKAMVKSFGATYYAGTVGKEMNENGTWPVYFDVEPGTMYPISAEYLQKDVWDSAKENFLRNVLLEYALGHSMITREQLFRFTLSCHPEWKPKLAKKRTDDALNFLGSKNGMASIEDVISKIYKVSWEEFEGEAQVVMEELKNLGFR